MSPSQATNLRAHMATVVLTIVGAVLLALMTGAWSDKETKADHATDVQRIESKIDRMFDLMCSKDANAQQCLHRP